MAIHREVVFCSPQRMAGDFLHISVNYTKCYRRSNNFFCELVENVLNLGVKNNGFLCSTLSRWCYVISRHFMDEEAVKRHGYGGKIEMTLSHYASWLQPQKSNCHRFSSFCAKQCNYESQEKSMLGKPVGLLTFIVCIFVHLCITCNFKVDFQPFTDNILLQKGFSICFSEIAYAEWPDGEVYRITAITLYNLHKQYYTISQLLKIDW